MIDTSLKHVSKKEFVIYYKTSEGRRYLNTIYSSSTNFTNDIDDALKIKNLEAAKGAFYLATSLCNNELHVCKVETIVEDVDINSKEEDDE